MNKNRNINIYEENTLPPRSHFTSYKNKLANESIIDCNGKWNFIHTDLESVEITTLDFSSSKIINVPSNVEMQGYFKKQYVNTQYPWEGHEKILPPSVPTKNSIACYSRIIKVAKKDAEKYIITFEGVESAFELYVNNHYIGYSEDSHTPAEFDITGQLINGENDVRVKVYKYSTASWLEDQDFWRIFGIHRDVYITKKPINYIADVNVKYEINFENSSVDLAIIPLFVNNLEKLESKLYLEGKEIAKFSSKTTINNAELWDVDRPKLYELFIETEFEVIKLTIGFREVRIKDSIFELNRKRIFFKGINRHDFSRKNGRAVTKEEIEWDIRFIKNNNFNAVRTSHYPNCSYLYELCDKYGIMVIDETNLETHGTWQHPYGISHDENTLPDNNPLFRKQVLKRGLNVLKRDINHASVVIWSLGNESFGGETLHALSQQFKELDSTRVVHYEGIFWDRRYNDSSDMESRMYPPFKEILDFINDKPEKPYLLCEYSHAMGNSNGNIHKYFELGKKNKYFQGGFIWEMFEHTLTKDGKEVWGGDFDDRPTDYFFVVDGIVTGNRKTTQKSDYIKYVQQPFEITKEDNSIIVKNIFDFKDVEKDYKIVIKDSYNKASNIILSQLLEIKNGEEIVLHVENSGTINIEIFDIYNVFNFSDSCVARKSFVSEKQVELNLDDSMEITFIENNVNLGIKGRGFHHMFHRDNAKFASITYNEVEFINKMGDSLTPHFWRCPTNNDMGAGKQFDLAIWRTLSYNSKIELVKYEKKNNYVLIETKFRDYEIFINYTINGEGKILTSMSHGDLSNLPPMFSFGFRLNMAKEFIYCDYEGNGPLESYSDRKENMLNGNFIVDVESQMKYVVPQEYGNRTDVNQVVLYNENNAGIKITSNKLFEFSYKKEADEALETMTNYGYCETNSNQLKIHSMMSGVAGDDSWGAWAWDEYQVKPTNNNIFKFIIERR